MMRTDGPPSDKHFQMPGLAKFTIIEEAYNKL